MKRIERELLKQLKVSDVYGIVQGNRLESLTSIRLWAAEKTMETQQSLPMYPCGEDLGDPLIQIHLKYARLNPQQETDKLVCPCCGEGDNGNRMNGKPWCIKCNVALASKAKMKKWMTTKVKILTKQEFLKKQLKGLARE